MVKNTTNSILGNVGIDLSDGFDEKDVYGLTGWIAQTAVDTGAFVVKTFVSTTVASTLGGGMIGTTGAFVVGKVVGPTIDEAFGEKAVEGVHTFLTSALEFFGIKAKPDEKETAEAGTEDVNAILAGDKADIEVKGAEVTKLSPEELAAEIWAGKWGNGADRKAALKEAGYSDAEIKAAQGVINEVYCKTGDSNPKNPGIKNPGPDKKQESARTTLKHLFDNYWNYIMPKYNDGIFTQEQRDHAREKLEELRVSYEDEYGEDVVLTRPTGKTGNSEERANAQRQIDNYWEYTYKEYQNGEISQEELSAQHDAVQKVVDQYYHNHPKAKKLNNENNPPKGGRK